MSAAGVGLLHGSKYSLCSWRDGLAGVPSPVGLLVKGRGDGAPACGTGSVHSTGPDGSLALWGAEALYQERQRRPWALVCLQLQ